MYFKMNVLGPVRKAYLFGCTGRLKQHSTTYSVMKKSMVVCATKKLPCSRIGERKGAAPHQTTRISVAFLTTIRQLITCPYMLETSQSHSNGHQ